jgi:hypothetical protein
MQRKALSGNVFDGAVYGLTKALPANGLEEKLNSVLIA